MKEKSSTQRANVTFNLEESPFVLAWGEDGLWPVVSLKNGQRSEPTHTHTHWDKTPCVTPQRRIHPHFAFALPNLNGFLCKQNGSLGKCVQMFENSNEEEGEIERGKRDTLRGRGGYRGSVGVVPWHKHVSQTVTMPVASPNYSTIVLISKSCISKTHEIFKHLRGWRCCKWGNG